MPATGFTMTVKKSDTIEIDITIDQAIQFIVSCSVVIPPQQLAANRVGPQAISKAVAEFLSAARRTNEHSTSSFPFSLAKSAA